MQPNPKDASTSADWLAQICDKVPDFIRDAWSTETHLGNPYSACMKFVSRSQWQVWLDRRRGKLLLFAFVFLSGPIFLARLFYSLETAGFIATFCLFLVSLGFSAHLLFGNFDPHDANWWKRHENDADTVVAFSTFWRKFCDALGFALPCSALGSLRKCEIESMACGRLVEKAREVMAMERRWQTLQRDPAASSVSVHLAKSALTKTKEKHQEMYRLFAEAGLETLTVQDAIKSAKARKPRSTGAEDTANPT